MPRPEKEADFETRCSVCDEMIYEGDRIGLIEHEGDWAHLACAEDFPWPEDP